MPRGIYMPEEKKIQCDKCKTSIIESEFLKSLKVCPHCNHHHYINAFERLKLLVDDGTFVGYDANLYSLNPLSFPEYEEKVAGDIQKTGLKSEMLTGEALIGSYHTAIGIGDSRIRMGSTGSVIGEKITRLIECAIEKRLPLIIVSPFGGGMRMQEGTISLMQMAKTAAACARYIEAGLFYISVLTQVTMGGNAASFASLAHVIIAEPGTIYGFAGDRTRTSIGMEMPPEVQTAEYQLEYGMIDMIVQRKDMRATLIDLLDFCSEE
jgi:acetyl-CoA carboxylase carboxyl transferase subunit beta